MNEYHKLNGPRMVWSQKDIDWFNRLTEMAAELNQTYASGSEKPTTFDGYLECDICDAIAQMNEEDPEFPQRLQEHTALHIIIHSALWVGIQLGATFEIR